MDLRWACLVRDGEQRRGNLPATDILQVLLAKSKISEINDLRARAPAFSLHLVLGAGAEHPHPEAPGEAARGEAFRRRVQSRIEEDVADEVGALALLDAAERHCEALSVARHADDLAGQQPDAGLGERGALSGRSRRSRQAAE